mmetsp:Transcript_85937/g.135685  ORF Transcript_85937/g.135685 Transcript_85937/m.135685 type:complete len:236 (-) Transcript_85937:101-808(-)
MVRIVTAICLVLSLACAQHVNVRKNVKPHHELSREESSADALASILLGLNLQHVKDYSRRSTLQHIAGIAAGLPLAAHAERVFKLTPSPVGRSDLAKSATTSYEQFKLQEAVDEIGLAVEAKPNSKPAVTLYTDAMLELKGTFCIDNSLNDAEDSKGDAAPACAKSVDFAKYAGDKFWADCSAQVESVGDKKAAAEVVKFHKKIQKAAADKDVEQIVISFLEAGEALTDWAYTVN